MNNILLENTITQDCLEILKNFLGKNLIIHPKPLGKDAPDARLTLLTKPRIELVGECKANIPTRANALYFIFRAKLYAGKDGKAILFTKWIPEHVAQELRKAGVYFVDTVGNAYVWNPPQILLDIRGKRPVGQQQPEPGRLIEVGGLKVCHLLITQGILNEPLRVIAEKANVALGTVHIVLRELTAARLLLPGPGRGHRFNPINPLDALLDIFLRGYGLKLRPACLIGRYRHKKNHPAEILAAVEDRLRNTDAKWALTGGVAAKHLTGYLEPDNITLFVDEEAEQRLKEEPMLPDANGNVTLLRLFAPTAVNQEKTPGLPLATPLLIYAELLNDGRPREVETAKMIYEKYFDLGNDRWKAHLKK